MPPRCWLAVSGAGPAPFQMDAQVLGCAAAWPAGGRDARPHHQAKARASVTAGFFVMNAVTWAFQLLGFPFSEIIRAPRFFKYWYLFPQLIWTPQEGASLVQAGHSAPRKSYSAEIHVLFCALHGQALSPALLQGLAHGRTLLQPLFPPTPMRGHIAASSCPQDPLGEGSLLWLSRNDRWTESA